MPQHIIGVINRIGAGQHMPKKLMYTDQRENKIEDTLEQADRDYDSNSDSSYDPSERNQPSSDDKTYKHRQ